VNITGMMGRFLSPLDTRKPTQMSASEAQITANRRNSQLSTGPKTEEGKERSRRNALKHGLTGDSVVLPDDEAAEVASRFLELQKELLPSGISSRLLLRRFASMSVRLEKCERLDTSVYAKRIRHADDDFVDNRMTQVEALVLRLAYDPMTTARRLQNTPEGIDWLIAHWGVLMVDLMNRERHTWTHNHWSRMDNLLGHPPDSFRQTRPHALTEALSGFSANINPSEIEGLNELEQIEWARAELVKIIDGEVARLEGVKESLDPWKIEQDRLEAADRCLFDLQPAMDRVRKYEAATERAMYRAMKEFRQLEAELKANKMANGGKELASSEPKPNAEDELAEVVAHSAPRTLPLSAQIPEAIHFPAKRTLDDAPRSLSYPGNVIR
jgi:hypothetical protein